MPQRGRNPDPDLLTIREVAEVLRMKPDTIYRWARRGRLGAVKLGKEWRVPASEIEAAIGQPLTRSARPTAGASPAAFPRAAAPIGEAAAGLEQRLQAFIVPRDQILAVAVDEPSLESLQAAFWRLAALSGGRLVVPRTEERSPSAEQRLAAEGLAPDAVVTVEDAAAARDAVAASARPGEPLWACYGMVEDLAASPGAIEAHSRMAAAAALTSDVISLSGALASGWEQIDFDARLRIRSHHRGLAEVSATDVVLARIR